MAMNETTLLNHIRLQASERGTTLFRNQTGRYELKDGRWLVSGLCVGSSDLIGWTVVYVTEAMVGRKLAVFTAVEAKSPEAKGKHAQPSNEQLVFIDAVRKAGGIAFCSNNLDDCMTQLLNLR